VIANQVAGLFGSPYIAPVGDYESIQTITASGSASYIEFVSIPSTYKHLQVRWIGRTNSSNTWDFPRMQVNGDTSSIYNSHNVYGDGSSTGAQGGASGTDMFISFGSTSSTTSNVMSATILDVLDYANTNKFKTIRSLSGVDANGSGYIALMSGLYRSTTAISSIKLFPLYGPNWTSTSTFALYGVK
jgi:hypothetical protein